MTSPHYNHDFLLNIGGINIGVYLGKDLYQNYTWREFFTNRLKSCLVDNTSDPSPAHKIVFTGPRAKLFKLDNRTTRKHIRYPQIKGRTLTFNNFLHPNLLVANLYPLIEKELAKKHLLTLHASGIVIDGCAILFSGASGSGKSTVLAKRPKESLILGDDKILLRTKNGKVMAIPSPLNDKIVVDDLPNTGVPVSGVVFIKKQSPTGITKISPPRALPLILNQLLTPPFNNDIRKMLLVVSRVLSQNTYRLSYTLGEDITPIIKEITK